MGAGRVICVGMPFALTIASLVCLLVVMFAGITEKKLDMFKLDTGNLSISTSSLTTLDKDHAKINSTSFSSSLKDVLDEKNLHHREIYSSSSSSASASSESDRRESSNLGKTTQEETSSSGNLTAKDLGLAEKYQIFLWNYCETNSGKTNCTKAKFNWADKHINVTLANERAHKKSGQDLPKEATDGLKAFVKYSKWSQILYIVSFILVVLELAVGFFGFCSRTGSCVTYVVSAFSTASVVAASVLSTITSAIVVAIAEDTSKNYGIKAWMARDFISVTWLAVAFSIAASLFWCFSACCCKGDRSKKAPQPYAPTGTYVQINENRADNAYLNPQERYKARTPVRGGAYEPYTSHAAV